MEGRPGLIGYSTEGGRGTLKTCLKNPKIKNAIFLFGVSLYVSSSETKPLSVYISKIETEFVQKIFEFFAGQTKSTIE